MKLVPVPDLKSTAFGNVRFTFVNITPEMAAEWLKRNVKNRSLKGRKLDGYILDMRNSAWLTTHECIAFDNAGNLIDGQHRLEAIVRARRTVLMVVSTGWPVTQGNKKTMDAVNMGSSRTLADQLHLQHDVEKRDAAKVVQICNAIAAASFGLGKVSESTTDTILGTYALYKKEITWLLAEPVKIHGIGQATVMAALAMFYALWPKETEDALDRLVTGANLATGNALLPLRNWLMSTDDDRQTVRQATFHHLYAFKNKQTAPQICINSTKAYLRVLELSKVRIEKICAIYNQAMPAFLVDEAEGKTNTKASATSEEALKIGVSLSATFSTTDLIARTDANAGQWLGVWTAKDWIQSAGVNQFRKTEKFGKP